MTLALVLSDLEMEISKNIVLLQNIPEDFSWYKSFLTVIGFVLYINVHILCLDEGCLKKGLEIFYILDVILWIFGYGYLCLIYFGLNDITL